MSVLVGVFSRLFVFTVARGKVADDSLVDCIDACLPQTQCRQCGYAGCRPYAQAIAAGAADINQCPPGGDAAIMALAELLGRPPKSLNTAHGVTKSPQVAVIDEETCIGCTLCIQACPVDAIVGAAKLMHTVIKEECTGCELCVPPCPVDCIAFLPVENSHTMPTSAIGDLIPLWSHYRFAKREIAVLKKKKQRADRARRRYESRQIRLLERQRNREAQLRQPQEGLRALPTATSIDAKKAVIAAAVARAKAKKALLATAQSANTVTDPPKIDAHDAAAQNPIDS